MKKQDAVGGVILGTGVLLVEFVFPLAVALIVIGLLVLFGSEVRDDMRNERLKRQLKQQSPHDQPEPEYTTTEEKT